MNIDSQVVTETTKKRHSAMLLFCIFCVQFAISTIIYNLSLITHFHHFWSLVYHALALIFVIPQVGLSDTYGRKKHLIIALVSVTLSVFLLFLVYVINFFIKFDLSDFSFITVLPICLLLGAAGNVIPIARAGIADLKIHDFRVAIGWSSVFIGFGGITPILLGLIFEPFGVLIIAIMALFISILVIKQVFFDFEDESVKIKKNANSSMLAIKNSYKWVASMFMVVGGTSALLIYLFSETSFYLVSSLAEIELGDKEKKVVGLIMPFGYAFGVVMQWIIYCSDKNGIKIGAFFSFIVLFLLFIFKSIVFSFGIKIENGYFYIIEGILNFLFAFGFGFLIPSLFSLMAKKIRPHHAGRLFGAIDITDTLALNFSAFILVVKQGLNFSVSSQYIFILIFFSASFVFYKLFLKRFSSYEKCL